MSFVSLRAAGTEQTALGGSRPRAKSRIWLLPILGGLAEQDNRARLNKLRRVTERRRAADLGQQCNFFGGIGIALEHTVQ